MTDSKFIEALTAICSFKGDRERQVEQIYNEMLKDVFPGITISNPFKCDGYFQLKTGSGKIGDVIIEYKFDEDLLSYVGRAKVLVQVLFYLKKIEKSEFPTPNVVLIGDANECLVLHVNPLIKYLDFPGVDWNVAPSNAANKNPDLVLAVSQDQDLNTWVFDIKDGFSFSDVATRITDAIDNITTYVHITEHNIDRIFSEFTGKVLKKSVKLSANDVVGVFMGCIVDPDGNYLHPKKKNVLVTTGYGEVQVNGGVYSSFFQRYEQKVPPFEKKRLVEICDRLIEDTTRRKKGEFYTPTAFVDYAHDRIEKVLGENWKDEYVVWDCCCGTKNLTRDYKFKELYCSTLEKSELDISERYNPEAVSFQFDFLNDDFEKLPEGLKEAFRNKKILFLMPSVWDWMQLERNQQTRNELN